MVKFNERIDNGYTVKRAYGGATTTRLKYYVKGDLLVDRPDTVIINAGTNNFTKTNQTVNQIANEILDIVKTCHEGQVKKICVSSITCRPKFQSKVDGVNKLLKLNAAYYNYDFIDNSCIRESHLKSDELHLNKQGTIILANNFLAHLNRPYVTLPFASIWD